jgi:hypothetical protein
MNHQFVGVPYRKHICRVRRAYFSTNHLQPCRNKLCALLLVDLSAHYYKLIQKLIKDKQYTEAKAFNLYFGYIDTALSITKWIQLIYTKELEKQLPLSHV